MTQRTVPHQLADAYPAPVAAVIMDLSEELVEIWKRQVDGDAETLVRAELPVWLSEVRRQYDVDDDRDDAIARELIAAARAIREPPAQEFALGIPTTAVLAKRWAELPEWLEPLTDLEEFIDAGRREEAEQRLVGAAYGLWTSRAEGSR
jgi:hypothetical protein